MDSKARFVMQAGDMFEVPDPEAMVKFNPNHDEKGRFSSGDGGSGMSAGAASKIIDRVIAGGGMSIRLTTGFEPKSGYMVATSAKYSKEVDQNAFNDRKTGIKILADYAKANKSMLVGGKYYLGLWADSGKVWLDVSERVMNLDKAIQAGSDRNQIAIWDVKNGTEISTGGTGVHKQSASGRDSSGHLNNVGRSDRSMGGEGLRQSRFLRIKFEAGLVPVLKFNPYHDEKGRFSSGDGYAQGGYTAQQTYNQNKMSGKGLTAMEIQDAMQNFGEYSPEQMVAKMQQVYGVKVSNGKGLTAQTVIETVRPYSGNSLVVTGQIQGNNGIEIGKIERVITLTDSGALQVDNHLLRIRDGFDEYKGMGLAKAVLAQGEAYAINQGFSKITVYTAWDGARTWARAGFDWSSSASLMKSNIDALAIAGSYQGLTAGDTTAGKAFNKMMSALTPDYQIDPSTGGNSALQTAYADHISIHPMTNNNFPIPNDFATLGWTRGAKDWVGKSLLQDVHMNYEKILNSEMTNLKAPPRDRNADGAIYSGSQRQRPVPNK